MELLSEIYLDRFEGNRVEVDLIEGLREPDHKRKGGFIKTRPIGHANQWASNRLADFMLVSQDGG